MITQWEQFYVNFCLWRKASRGMQWCGSGLRVPLKSEYKLEDRWCQRGPILWSSPTPLTCTHHKQYPKHINIFTVHTFASVKEACLQLLISMIDKNFHANYIVHNPICHFIITYWRKEIIVFVFWSTNAHYFRLDYDTVI